MDRCRGTRTVPMLNPLYIHTHMLTYTSVHIHLCTGKEGREPVPMLNPLSPKPYLPTPRPTVQVSLLSAFLLHCTILVRGWCGVLIGPGAGLGYVRARTQQAEHARARRICGRAADNQAGASGEYGASSQTCRWSGGGWARVAGGRQGEGIGALVLGADSRR